jgi:hypothetical protein
MSETGYHFQIWDYNPWLAAKIKQLITPSQQALLP